MAKGRHHPGRVRHCHPYCHPSCHPSRMAVRGWCHLLGDTVSCTQDDWGAWCHPPVMVSPSWCWPVLPSGTFWVWGRLVSLLWGPLASPMGTLRDTWTPCHSQSPDCCVCQGRRAGRWVSRRRGDPAGRCQAGRAGMRPSRGPQHCQGNTGCRTQRAGGHSGGRRRPPPPARW